MAIELYSKATLDTLLAAKLSEAPIDGTIYGRKDGAWEAIVGGAATWGAITGTVTDQTDLTTYLSDNYYPLSSNPAGYLTSVPGKSVNDISAVVPYTLQLSDANNVVYCAGGTFQMIIVPNDGAVDFPIGTEITIVTNDTYNWVTGGIYGPYPTINGSSGNVAVGGYVTKMVKVAAETWFLG